MKKNEGEWTGTVEISSRKKSLAERQKVQHPWLYSDLLQALKGEPLSSGFPTEGFSVSAPALPHCRGRRKSFAVRKTHFTSDKYEAPSCIHTLSNTFHKSRHKCKESGLKTD